MARLSIGWRRSATNNTARDAFERASHRRANHDRLRMTERTKMKQIIATAISLALLAAAAANAQNMEITPNGSRPSAKGAAENFTGSVVLTPLFGAAAHTRATGGYVTFEPGARSTWHTHPAGQILIVMSGTGWVQEEGGPKLEIKPGDVIW